MREPVVTMPLDDFLTLIRTLEERISTAFAQIKSMEESRGRWETQAKLWYAIAGTPKGEQSWPITEYPLSAYPPTIEYMYDYNAKNYVAKIKR